MNAPHATREPYASTYLSIRAGALHTADCMTVGTKSGGKHGQQQPESRVRKPRAAAAVQSASQPAQSAADSVGTAAAEQPEPAIPVRQGGALPARRRPWPSDGEPYTDTDGSVKRRRFGDDPCFNCGQPGSTCQDCGAVICDACNTHSNAPAGHEPAAHLEAPPVPDESEDDRLIRENRELEAQIRGSMTDRLRRRNAELRQQLEKQQQPPTDDSTHLPIVGQA